MAQKQTVTIDGHRLTLTNLDKVLYPQTGTTKGDVLSYYAAIADVLIPHAADRPVTRKRWVNGVGTPEDPGEVFFQKNLDDSTPSWVRRHSIEHKERTNEYPLLNDLATLTWLGQIAALELHVPQWRFGPRGAIRNPDRLVLDLDPGEGATLADCAEVARLARGILKDLGRDPMPVTSGSKGIHLYAGLDGTQTSQQVSDVAHELARALEADHPELVVSDMKKSLRGGKVFVDWSQNSWAKTTVTPYSLRGRFRPTVATPRTWRELASNDLAQLEYDEVVKRMKRRKDPLASLAHAHPHGDRLTGYREKRDASKTSEPMPGAGDASVDADGDGDGDGRSFVIQEHHARALHWDFRLEHDGVLVSWALPKGVPTEPTKNHLAVQTEDHPLEYGSFEGHIPRGEYGGGDVSIWDAGEYELEKWRDGREIIVTLHGRPDGGLTEPRKLALIHTGGEGKAAQNWLIHLMKDSPTKRSRAIAPMLATLGSEAELSEDADWAFEMKWDGIRVISTIDADGVRLHTRNGNDVTATYPEIGSVLAECIDEAALHDGAVVLDGEVVAVNKKGHPDFGLLQQRMGLNRTTDVEEARRSTPVQYLLFDVLQTGGKRVTDREYDERRRLLEEVVRPKGAVQLPPVFDGDIEAAMRSSRELGLEGVMAKKRDSTYRLGRRSRAWIKVKHHLTQEVVVGGWRPGKGRRANGVGSLLLGIPDAGGLRYIGRVGTGFGDRELDDIASKLARRTRKTSPFADVPQADASDANWVTPNLVGEVEFAEWTTTKRLRQPSWRGWRPDKDVDEVTEES